MNKIYLIGLMTLLTLASCGDKYEEKTQECRYRSGYHRSGYRCSQTTTSTQTVGSKVSKPCDVHMAADNNLYSECLDALQEATRPSVLGEQASPDQVGATNTGR